MGSDFLIVGGGAVGLASAHALLRMGYTVTLVERGTVGKEASWAGGGILSPLCPWDYGEDVTRLALRGMRMMDEFAPILQASTGVDPEYSRCGMLVLPPLQIGRAEDWCAAHGMVSHRVGVAQYGLSGEGLLLPDIAQVRNPRLLAALRHRVELYGGEIVEDCEVLDFDIGDGADGERVTGLHTSRGRMSAGAYVVAAGAWSRQLLGGHALGLEVKPIRGQILLFKFDGPPFREILLRENLYFIPRNDGHVLVGSTLEDAGFDRSITLEARDSLLSRVRELFPGWPEPVQQWAGFRPGSPDNVPTIGRHPQLSNLYANTGHFRYGVTMSLASAEILLNLIEEEPQSIEIDAYRWRSQSMHTAGTKSPGLL